MPPVSVGFGVGSLAAEARAGSGNTYLVIPPLGSVWAHTHLAPLDLQVTLTQLNPLALGRELGRRGHAALTHRVEGDLRALALRLGLRLVLGALVIGAVVGLLLPGRRWRHALWSAGGALLVIGGSLLSSAVTYHVSAFAQPRFTGILTRAPQVIEAIGGGPQALGNLSSRYANAADRMSRLIALATRPPRAPGTAGATILHVSDIHSNPLGVVLARQLARGFHADAVIDTGDITTFGKPIEARIGHMLQRFPVPYYFVGGNHDSPQVRRRIAAYRNVTSLDRRVIDIAGVRVAGWSDPAFTASGAVSTAQDNRANLREAPEVAAFVRRKAPQVLAVHNRLLASDAVGHVPLVISGHTHQQDMRVVDGTLVLTVGSTGATGLGSFTVSASQDYEASILHFDEHGRLASLDYVRFHGEGGRFDITHYDFTGPDAIEVPARSGVGLSH